MDEFHLDARSKIGGPPTSCSQPEQRSLFLRPKNKIPLHGIFTGEDESTKISRSCSPSMFMGRVKPHFSNRTTNSSQDKETTTNSTKENEAEEEESKEELFAVESYVVLSSFTYSLNILEHQHSNTNTGTRRIWKHRSNLRTVDCCVRFWVHQTVQRKMRIGSTNRRISIPHRPQHEQRDSSHHPNRFAFPHPWVPRQRRVVRLFLPSAVRKLLWVEINHGFVNAVRLVFRLNRQVKQDPL